jgi:hypothetical protein
MVLELGGGAQLLRLGGAVLAAMLVAGVVAALLIPRTDRRKAIWMAVLVVPVLIPVVVDQIELMEIRHLRVEAKRLFDEHCKSAGIRIYKTVTDVDGVFLMKRRPPNQDSDAQDAPDPYGNDLPDEAYAYTMLWGRGAAGLVLGTADAELGYSFAVLPNADGNGYIRYHLTGNKSQSGELEVRGAPATSLPRYGISWEEISSPKDREHWIAGSRLFVVDTQTREVIAERIGWMFDPGLGSQSGGRQPWSFARANACPPFRTLPNGHPWAAGQARDFVERVLIPSKESRR